MQEYNIAKDFPWTPVWAQRIAAAQEVGFTMQDALDLSSFATCVAGEFLQNVFPENRELQYGPFTLFNELTHTYTMASAQPYSFRRVSELGDLFSDWGIDGDPVTENHWKWLLELNQLAPRIVEELENAQEAVPA